MELGVRPQGGGRDFLDPLLLWAFPRQTRKQRHLLFAIVLGWWVFFFITPSGHDLLYYYLPALRGEFAFFYPYWVHWFIQPLAWFPYPINQWVWMSITIALLIVASRLTTSNPYQLFLGFPFAWIMWYGQIETLPAIGIVFLWRGLQNSNFLVMGLGLLLASIKPHIAGPAALLIWTWVPSWSGRIKTLWLLAPLVLLSFFVFGLSWPLEWLSNIHQPFFPESFSNASLFRWFGYGSFFLWFPAVLIPMSRFDRLQAILATTLLTMPYVPVYSQLVLYFWAMPWWQWIFGQLVWFQPYLSDIVYRYCFLLPFILLGRIYLKIWQSSRLVP